MGYDSKGILVFNLKYEHAISFINLVKFINYYQMPRSISSKLFGEANVYGSSYYWNFRTSSFKQVACLILKKVCIMYMFADKPWLYFQNLFQEEKKLPEENITGKTVKLWFFSKKIFWFPMLLKKIFWFWWRKKKNNLIQSFCHIT
jgi:hypothetical protein